MAYVLHDIGDFILHFPHRTMNQLNDQNQNPLTFPTHTPPPPSLLAE